MWIFASKLSWVSLFATTLYVASASAQETIRVPQNISTVQAAIDKSVDGDTVLVSPGIYNENISFKGKAITVTSGAQGFTDPAAASTILNGTSDGPVVTFAANETAGAVLNGFTVQNGHAYIAQMIGGGIFVNHASPQITNNLVTNNIGCGVYVVNAANPLIQGNDIRQTMDSGKSSESECNSTYGFASRGTGLALAKAGNVQIVGNTIEENNVVSASDGECGAGVFVTGGIRILLQNNIIRNNHGPCNQGLAVREDAAPEKLILIQNLFYGNTDPSGNSLIQVFVPGTFSPPYPSLIEINNTIYGGGQETLLNFSESAIANNIFVNTTLLPTPNETLYAGISCQYPQIYNYPELNHNLVFNFGILIAGGCSLGEGNLAVNPQFVNLSESDFHAQPSSPTIATGDLKAMMLPAADLDKKVRIVCDTVDMGVYELHPHPSSTLTASPNPTPGRSTVTLTATLTGNCNIPSGLVTFLDGETVLGTAQLNSSGVATFTTSFLFVGTHLLTASYLGDFNFEDSASNTITEVITGPPTTTLLEPLDPSPAHSLESVTMTATVGSAYDTPTGTVTFKAGTTLLATAPIGASGLATAPVNTLRAGTYTITAVYNGSTQYAGSISNALIENVLGADTTTALTASPNPVNPGQSVTFTANVKPLTAGLPVTGTVTFKDAATILATAPVTSAGAAMFSTSSLLTGTHVITASYGGSQELNGSVSAPINLIVTSVPTNIGLSVSPNPATIGQNVTMVATVVSTIPNQVPAGTVTFADDTTVLGTAPLVSGVASFSINSLKVGSHQLRATLNPSGSYASSASAVVAEVINDFNFSVRLSSTSLTIPTGDYQKISVILTPSGGFPGAVNLGCSTLPDHAQCIFESEISKPLSDGTQTITLTINTSDIPGYGRQIDESARLKNLLSDDRFPLFATLFPFTTLFFLQCGFYRRTRFLRKHLVLVSMMLGLGLCLAGCSGKLPGTTLPGDYIITLTAADVAVSSSLVHEANISLHVIK